jgi:hypothetical protein
MRKIFFSKQIKKEKAKKSAKISGVGNTHVPGKNKCRSVTSVVSVCEKNLSCTFDILSSVNSPWRTVGKISATSFLLIQPTFRLRIK